MRTEATWYRTNASRGTEPKFLNQEETFDKTKPTKTNSNLQTHTNETKSGQYLKFGVQNVLHQMRHETKSTNPTPQTLNANPGPRTAKPEMVRGPTTRTLNRNDSGSLNPNPDPPNPKCGSKDVVRREGPEGLEIFYLGFRVRGSGFGVRGSGFRV